MMRCYIYNYTHWLGMIYNKYTPDSDKFVGVKQSVIMQSESKIENEIFLQYKQFRSFIIEILSSSAVEQYPADETATVET